MTALQLFKRWWFGKITHTALYCTPLTHALAERYRRAFSKRYPISIKQLHHGSLTTGFTDSDDFSTATIGLSPRGLLRVAHRQGGLWGLRGAYEDIEYVTVPWDTCLSTETRNNLDEESEDYQALCKILVLAKYMNDTGEDIQPEHLH